jgi:D-3-phosphoglycerate dehydrogenase
VFRLSILIKNLIELKIIIPFISRNFPIDTMNRVFVSTFPFGKSDPTPRNLLLAEENLQVSFNPLARKLTNEEVCSLALEADAIIAGTEDLSLLINKSDRLRLISRVGIGLDSVDLKLCREKGIRVCYTPDAVTMAVAELTLGLMIAITRQVNLSDREIREGKWVRNYGKRLGESVIGLIGFGRVGKSVARLLAPFGPEILIHDIRDFEQDTGDLRRLGQKVRTSSKEEIFTNADVVSLHVPAYAKTKELINTQSLRTFKKDSFLINTARGELVNEEDLFEALSSGVLAGAALDVFCKEPYEGPLSNLPNVILTQHMGSCSYDCRLAMESQATEDLIRFLNGKDLLREVPEVEYSYQ